MKYALSTSTWTTTPQPESSGTGMYVPSIWCRRPSAPCIGKEVVPYPPLRERRARESAAAGAWIDCSRKMRTISTPERSSESGRFGSEWAIRRPRLSTT